MATVKKGCNCSNEYQDEKCGKGVRIHNTGGTNAKETYSCTVCGNKK